MKIIGLCGPAGTGKSTIAEEITFAHGAGSKVFSLADPIKDIAHEYFGWNGIKDERGRALLKAIGMAGRAYDSMLWVNKCEDAIVDAQEAGYRVAVIDDVRFDNEAQWIRENGGTVIELVGRTDYISDDPTERGLRRDLIDETLYNFSGKRHVPRKRVARAVLELTGLAGK